MEISALVAEDENKKEKSCFRKYLELIKNFIIKNFLPISLIVAVVFGVLVPQPGVALNHKATLYVCVVGIFLYSGLYLRTDALKEVVKSYKAALWGILSILAFTSIIGGKLTMLLDFNEEYVSKFNQSMKNSSSNSTLQNNLSSRISLNQNFTGTKYKHGLGPAEFKVGLLVFFCMPCTISSGVVMVSFNLFFFKLSSSLNGPVFFNSWASYLIFLQQDLFLYVIKHLFVNFRIAT